MGIYPRGCRTADLCNDCRGRRRAVPIAARAGHRPWRQMVRRVECPETLLRKTKRAVQLLPELSGASVNYYCRTAPASTLWGPFNVIRAHSCLGWRVVDLFLRITS